MRIIISANCIHSDLWNHIVPKPLVAILFGASSKQGFIDQYSKIWGQLLLVLL